MKTVVFYIAKDGSKWENEVDAKTREEILDTVKKMISPLGEKVTTPGVFVQHNPKFIFNLKESFWELCKKYTIPTKNKLSIKENKISRIETLSLDGVYSPINEAIKRITCIDESGREFWSYSNLSSIDNNFDFTADIPIRCIDDRSASQNTEV